MAQKYKLTLKAKNLGPLTNLSFEKEMSSLKFVIFAKNGSGKTFISRSFDYLDKIQKGKSVEGCEHLISFGAKEAEFDFSFSDKNILQINVTHKTSPTSTLDTSWIIHTFNCDFIKRHLTPHTFTLKDKIEGDIVIGEENGTIFQLQEQLESIKRKKEELQDKLRRKIDSGKKQLSDVRYIKSLTEYKNISYENLSVVLPNTTISFQQAQENWKKLQNIPEDLKVLEKLNISIDLRELYKIPSLLTQEVSLSKVAEEYKQKIQDNYAFISAGVNSIRANSKICPFCEQSLVGNAQRLIDSYIMYFNDEEAKFEQEIENKKKYLESLKKRCKDILGDFFAIKDSYDKQKVHFPSIAMSALKFTDQLKTINSDIDQLNLFLDQKSDDKTKRNFVSAPIIDSLSDQIDLINKESETINQLIDKLEYVKAHTKEQEKTAKINLCNSLLLQLQGTTTEEREEISSIDREISKLEKEIQEYQYSSKIAKQEKVDGEFSKLLKEFFEDKYTYDCENHVLRLNNKYMLNEAAEEIISEGEKSIIAFCYYLSLIHSLVDSKQDYAKLLLVIDDPISSLDFNFVYQIAQEIRDLNKNYDLSYSRFIILTHNIEFTSVLIKNKIVDHSFVLNNSEIRDLNTSFLLPYEQHLRHVYEVSKGEKVDFQTPNSIRHILETVCNFRYPDLQLEQFIEKENVFKNWLAGYTLIQDLSHGRMRSCSSCTPENLKHCCELVIQYLEKTCPGQISKLQF